MRISDWSSDVCSSDLQNRVAVACFASNVARLETVIQVAEDCGRRICLLGRSMHRIVECARESGYLLGHRTFVSEEEVDYLPRNEVDRKSVVQGKSVSVRVDFGGRRIIQTKKYTVNTQHTDV